MWIHLLATELIRGAGGGYNTWWDSGYWAEHYLRMWNRPAKKIKQEVAQLVRDNPQKAIEAVPEVRGKVKAKYGEIDYSQVIANASMQQFVITQILAEMQKRKDDEDDVELLMLAL